MAIFSRRAIQRMLDENSRWARLEDIQKHVDWLNDSDRQDFLAAEWEVAVLNAFSKLGELQHERAYARHCNICPRKSS
jgi:hypothetical protein